MRQRVRRAPRQAPPPGGAAARVGAGVLLLLLVAGWSARVEAQGDRCTEPTDAAYTERMDAVAEAIEDGDYELVLTELDWAVAHYNYAVLEYSRARALHNLDRLAEAEEAYNRFMRAFEGCPDPDLLILSARQYRSLAVAQQADELAQEEGRSPGENGENGPLGSHRPPDDTALSAGWYVVAGGGALLAAGLFHDLARAHLIDDRQRAYDAGDVAAFESIDGEIDRARTVDWVLYGSGVVVVLTGVVVVLLDRPSEPVEEAPPLSMVPARGGVLVQYGVRF